MGRAGARAGVRQPLALSLGGVENENELFLSVPHVPLVTALDALPTSSHGVLPGPMRDVSRLPFYNW